MTLLGIWAYLVKDEAENTMSMYEESIIVLVWLCYAERIRWEQGKACMCMRTVQFKGWFFKMWNRVEVRVCVCVC